MEDIKYTPIYHEKIEESRGHFGFTFANNTGLDSLTFFHFQSLEVSGIGCTWSRVTPINKITSFKRIQLYDSSDCKYECNSVTKNWY